MLSGQKRIMCDYYFSIQKLERHYLESSKKNRCHYSIMKSTRQIHIKITRNSITQYHHTDTVGAVVRHTVESGICCLQSVDNSSCRLISRKAPSCRRHTNYKYRDKYSSSINYHFAVNISE